MTILTQNYMAKQYPPILKPSELTNQRRARCHLCDAWLPPGSGLGYTYLIRSHISGEALYTGERVHYLCPACQDRYEQDLSEEARRTLGVYDDDECTCRPNSDIACPACSRMFGKIDEDGFPF
jgi:hypothetical protein